MAESSLKALLQMLEAYRRSFCSFSDLIQRMRSSSGRSDLCGSLRRELLHGEVREGAQRGGHRLVERGVCGCVCEEILGTADERREHAVDLGDVVRLRHAEVLLRVLRIQARRHVANATTKVTRKRGNHSGLSFRKRQRRTSFRCSFWRTRSMSGWSIPHK